MLDGILMVIIGAIAAMSLITAKLKGAEKPLNFLVQFQGWLGILALIWGIIELFRYVIGGLAWIGTWPLGWITSLVITVVEIVIGFILGFGLLSKYVLSKSAEAKKKADELLAKLSPLKTTLGLIGICAGIWTIIYYLVLQPLINI